MSFQNIIAEQRTITSEQSVIRAELQRLFERLDANLKQEIQRITRRLDDNDTRISKLTCGAESLFENGSAKAERKSQTPVPSPLNFSKLSRQTSERHISNLGHATPDRRGTGSSPDQRARAGSPNSRASHHSRASNPIVPTDDPPSGRDPSPLSRNRYHSDRSQDGPSGGVSRHAAGQNPQPRDPQQRSISPLPSAHTTSNSSRMARPRSPTRRSDAELAHMKKVLGTAIQFVDKRPVWEEPAELKANPAAMDRCEALLRDAIERSKEFQRNTRNPMQCLQLIFQRLDWNHNGKIDSAGLHDIAAFLGFEADAKILTGLFSRFDVDRAGSLTMDEFGRAIFKLDGDWETKAKGAIARLREVLRSRPSGMDMLRLMSRQLRTLDQDGSGFLTREEFNICLETLSVAHSVKFSVAERNAMFQKFDPQNSGYVSNDDFVRGIRGDMNDFRSAFVRDAFKTLDKDGSGIASMQDMANAYDAAQNPHVKSRRITAMDAVKQFMKQYEGNTERTISLREFAENYQWVSAAIDTDDFFELMMCSAWHISSESGAREPWVQSRRGGEGVR